MATVTIANEPVMQYVQTDPFTDLIDVITIADGQVVDRWRTTVKFSIAEPDLFQHRAAVGWAKAAGIIPTLCDTACSRC